MKAKQLRIWFANKFNVGKLISKIEGDPRKIASGYSLGIFVGMMPLVGVKAFIAVAVASVFKWNKLAAGVGVFNINPITAPFFFGLNYLVGKQFTGCSRHFVFHEALSFKFIQEFFLNGSEVLLTLAIGGLILGVPFSFIAYQITYHIIRKYRIKTEQP